MINQNNAAQAAEQDDIIQPVLTETDIEEIRQDWHCFFQSSTQGGVGVCIRDIERRVLSKLRAPVSDPAIVGWRDPDCGRMAQKGPPHGYNRYSEALMTVAEHRALMAAALASAPVAVERPDGLRMLLAELPGMREDPKQGDAVFRCGVNGGLNAVEGRIRELLRSAPVAGEPFMYGILGPDGKAHFEEFCVSGDRTELQTEVVEHLNRDNPEDGTYSVVALFRDAASQARPFDDDLWDQALKERDHYHDMADRLASAIGTYFGADVGEHSSSHSPWREALGIIDEAAPRVSVQDVRNAALEEAYEAVACLCAADYLQSKLSNVDEPLRALEKAGDHIRALKPPQADKREVSAWLDTRAAQAPVTQPEQGERDADKA